MRSLLLFAPLVVSGALLGDSVPQAPPQAASATFRKLADLAADPGNGTLYLLDGTDGTIFRLASGGGSPQPWASAAVAQLAGPAALSLDVRTDEVFVADTFNYRVVAVSPRDQQMHGVAGVGRQGMAPERIPPPYPTYGMIEAGRFGGDGGPASAAQLNLPSGVCADPVGILFIADSGNHRIRAVNRGTSPVILMGVEIGPGEIETIAGTGTLGFSGDGGKATAAQLAFPTHLAVDTGGSLLVVDTFNQRLRRIDRQSGIIKTVARGALASAVTPERALESWSVSIVSVAISPRQEIVYVDRVERAVHILSRGAEDRVVYTSRGAREGQLATVAVGVRGEVYAADTYHNRVLRIEDGKANPHIQGAETSNHPLVFPK